MDVSGHHKGCRSPEARTTGQPPPCRKRQGRAWAPPPTPDRSRAAGVHRGSPRPQHRGSPSPQHRAVPRAGARPGHRLPGAPSFAGPMVRKGWSAAGAAVRATPAPVIEPHLKKIPQARDHPSLPSACLGACPRSHQVEGAIPSCALVLAARRTMGAQGHSQGQCPGKGTWVHCLLHCSKNLDTCHCAGLLAG